ncbi:MAG: class I SAM-dependent methyltransferase [Pleurocapsa sp.]
MIYSSKINDKSRQISVNRDLNPEYRDRYQKNRQLIQLFNSIQLGLAEMYLRGLEIPDAWLRNAFNVVITALYRRYSLFLIPEEWILTESSTLAEKSQELMELQYNLPPEMFRLMLEENNLLYPKYTTALWEKGAKNLTEAQLNMLEDAIAKANIQDGDSVLDIGCGWGSAAHYILHKFPNTQVTGLNLSREQCNYIRNKMQDKNSYFSSSRFTLIEGDFNEINFDKKFDKIISLGVFEHIGNLTQSFEKISSFLQADGRVFIHIISVKLPHNIGNPFIDKYIFPRARVWHYEMIPSGDLGCSEAPGDRHLKTIDRWFLNGSNYARTLQAWLDNFDRTQDKIKTLNYSMDYQRFRRMWRLYLILCNAYFNAGQGEILGNGQYLMVHS